MRGALAAIGRLTAYGLAVHDLGELGPGWQLSMADPGGWDDSRRWWCWLPVELGGNGTQHMAPTPWQATRAAMRAEGLISTAPEGR